MAMPLHPTSGVRLELLCPVVACDACGQIIDADRPGILLYDGDDYSRERHVHKGACDHAFERTAGEYARRHLWRDLDEWLAQLARNYADPLTRPRNITMSSGDTFRVTDWATTTGRETGSTDN